MLGLFRIPRLYKYVGGMVIDPLVNADKVKDNAAAGKSALKRG